MTNNFFMPLENTKPYLKMAFEGFAKSGKTYTAAQVAIGLHKHIKSTKPIVWVDTEKALKALKKVFLDEGIKVITSESRTLADLVKTVKFCEDGEPTHLPNGADIMVIDSISHVWETFVETYKKQKNRSYISIPDWGIIKPKWKKEFCDLYTMSNLHIIFTGRAAYEYEEIKDEESHKIQTVKSGIKMRAETETAFEPDILIRMVRTKEFDGKMESFSRSAQVQDRTNTIDGKIFINPTFSDFKPAIDVLLDGVISNKEISETPDNFTTNEEEYYQNKKQRDIYLEEIKAILSQLFSERTDVGKKLKFDIMEHVFNTRSMTKVETYPLEQLYLILEKLKSIKPKIDEYMKSCADEGITFDANHVLEIFASKTYVNGK
jgi:hypothetical protein